VNAVGCLNSRGADAPGEFIPKFPLDSILAISTLFVLKIKGCASVVPIKSVAGFVPALPCNPHPLVPVK